MPQSPRPTPPATGIPGGATRIPLQPGQDARDLADRYRLLVEVIPDGVLVRQDGRVTYANPAAQRMLGRTPEDILGLEIGTFVHPDHRAALAARMAALGQPDRPSGPVETLVLRADGSTLLVEAVAIPTTWKGMPAVQVLFRDLTDLVRSQEAVRYQAMLVEQVSDAIIGTAADGVVTSWNPAAGTLFGTAAADAVGRGLADLLGPALAPDRLVGAGPAQVVLDRPDGVRLTVRASATALADASGYVLICSDDTARRDAEQRYSAVLAALEEGVVAIDAEGLVTTVNPAAQQLLGRPEAALVGLRAVDLPLLDGDGEPLGRLNPLVVTHLTGRPQHGRSLVADRPDGSRIWLTANARPLLNRPSCPAVLSFTDVTERRTAAARLEHAASHDALTGLRNRASLLDRITEVRDGDGAPPVLALLYVDLDDFKSLNDAAGHALGDEALKLASKRLSGQVRDSDVVARMGGDEFVVLASVATTEDAQALAARVLAGLSRPATGRLRGHQLRASIGVVTATPDDLRTPADLLRDADAAMNQAKAMGRNRWVLFDVEMRADVLRRMQLESGLREALAGSGLWVAYQPLVDLASGRWTGAEALSRWTHPTLGQINPLEFIGVAEQSDLIHLLGRRTLATACRDAVTLRAGGCPGLTVSVNVSVRQLDDPELADHVKDILKMSGLPADALCLEVTESSLALDEVRAGRSLHPLRELGVRVAIDDFGTGYSSLARLRTLPVDELKIDRSFVTTLPTDRQARHVVSGIITLAHALDMRVVAEGVETAEHAAILAGMDCDIAQGYHFSRPVRVGEFAPPA